MRVWHTIMKEDKRKTEKSVMLEMTIQSFNENIYIFIQLEIFCAWCTSCFLALKFWKKVHIIHE